jgi:PAS domain S-box-containing protein
MPHLGRYIDEESFRRLMQRALIFPLILAIGLAGIFLWQVRGLLQINKWVDEGDRIISKAEHLELSVTEMETGVRGYILFGTKDYQDFFQKSEVEIPTEINELKTLLSDNPAQLAILAEVEHSLNRWISSARETLAIREKAGSLTKYRPTGKGRPVMGTLKVKLRTFINAEIEVRNERFHYARRTTRYVMFFGIFLALLLGLVLAIFSRRALMRLSLSYQGAFAGFEKKSQELAEAESRFRAMADAAPVLIWTTNQHTGCDWVSQGWLNYTGTNLEQALGTGWADYIHPEDRQNTIDRFQEASAQRSVLENDFRLRRKDGEYRWFATTGNPRFAPDHTFLGYIGSCTDVTDHFLAKQALEKALGTRDEFISVASHELRTPLTSLKLQLQMAKREIERDKLPNSIERNVSISLGQVQRLTNLVDKLLDISRIQTGRLEVELEKVDLSKLTSELLDHFQGEFRKVGSQMQAEIDPGIEAVCDRFRIEQVFVNLITNAIKYGQGKPITVSLRRKKNSVTYSVLDHGQGISAEEQEKIFERFQRAGASKNVDGIGLGLYIAREVVRAHRGRIYVESDGSSGSAFHVDIPI